MLVVAQTQFAFVSVCLHTMCLRVCVCGCGCVSPSRCPSMSVRLFIFMAVLFARLSIRLQSGGSGESTIATCAQLIQDRGVSASRRQVNALKSVTDVLAHRQPTVKPL